MLGILASRVVERTGRPTLVLAHEGAECHGSGRSVPGFHLLDALTAVHLQEDADAAAETLFSRFGGHSHAVGLALPLDRLPSLRRRLLAHSELHLPDRILSPPLLFETELEHADLTDSLADWVSRCAPFGNGNREPRFLLRAARLRSEVRIIRERHICFSLESEDNRPALQAVGWSRRAAEWAERAAEWQLRPGSSIDLVFRLRTQSTSWFQGLELQLEDLRLACD